jgi:peptidoglycan hydrolase-like protein with peptidoglycan-binding domain
MGQVDRWSRRAWMTLLASGDTPVVKYGSYGEAVYRVQRALDASSKNVAVPVTGTFDTATDAALRAWQTKNGLEVSGVAGTESWAQLQAGNR